MEINWIFNNSESEAATKGLIDREFSIRTMLSKLILNDPYLGNCDDLDSFSFNFHLETGKITVSKKTPEPYYTKIKRVLKMHPLIYDDGLGDLKVG
ncbi:hypothetical protein GTQ40_15785 [Flavobacteriaceae bacterium R38]|nr:hypothetical protein [Flavobacteriaceae bacterium R38]